MASTSSSNNNSVTSSTSLKDLVNNCAVKTPLINLDQLTDPQGYQLLSLKRAVSRFGGTIVAKVVVPERDNTVFHTFLPKRYYAILTDENNEAYNRDPHYRLAYCGVGPSKEHLIKFI